MDSASVAPEEAAPSQPNEVKEDLEGSPSEKPSMSLVAAAEPQAAPLLLPAEAPLVEEPPPDEQLFALAPTSSTTEPILDSPAAPDDAAAGTNMSATDAALKQQQPAGGDRTDVALLPANHPLLRRAQEALHRQLVEEKLRLQEELRERKKALKDAKQRREDVGVELYGFQQHLAKLQLSLEKAGDEHEAAAAARSETDTTLAALRSQVAEGEKAAVARRAQVEALQKELDRLAGNLRAIQAHNEVVASEVAAAKRQTYATEGAVQALETKKKEQDFLIDSMQQQLRRLGRQAALQAAALEAQRSETAVARQFTAQAMSDMEAVAFEKKQLLSQWRSSLVAMAKRDASLEKLHDTLQQQQEQQASILNESEGYLRQLAQQRQRNEQAGEVVGRLEAHAGRLAVQVERVQQRHAELQESHLELQRQLAERQAELDAAAAKSAKLAAQKATLERQQSKVAREAAAVEKQALERLGEQTFAEKGAQHTLRDIEAVRAAVREKEATAEQLCATLERLEADVATIQGRNDRLAAVLAGLEAVLADRTAFAAALEAEMKAGHADVECKTRQLDALNRRLQRMVDNAKDVETGPLEATIANLQREIAAKEAAARDLQRRWIGVQGQLVAAQVDNAELAQEVGAMRAQQAVMQQKRARLDSQFESQQREARALSKTLSNLRTEAGRLNGLLAEAAGQRSALHEDNVVLEGKLTAELKVLEARWGELNASIEELRAERREVLAAVVEAEREVMVWERRVQLEKEMQDAVDPAYGNEELSAARKEVARLSHASAALARQQEALVRELERAVEKREAISTKARVAQGQRIRDMTATQIRRQTADLEKAAARAEREGRAADGRLVQMGGRIQATQAAAAAAAEQCQVLQEQQAGVHAEIEVLGRERHKALVATSLKQREAKRYEEALAGRYKPTAHTLGSPSAASAALAARAGGAAAAEKPVDKAAAVAAEAAARAAAAGQADGTAAVAAETGRAKRKQERLRAAVEGLAAAVLLEAPQLERVLAHVAALGE